MLLLISNKLLLKFNISSLSCDFLKASQLCLRNTKLHRKILTIKKDSLMVSSEVTIEQVQPSSANNVIAKSKTICKNYCEVVKKKTKREKERRFVINNFLSLVKKALY